MEQSFEQALEAWRDYYTALAAVGAALLGLLFVAVSLRLNLFHEEQVADVRAFAVLAYGSFLMIVVIALLCLAPDMSAAELGATLAVLGALGIGWTLYMLRLMLRLGNQGPEPPPAWRWPYLGAVLVAYGGLAASGVVLFTDRTAPLDWLLPITLALLVLAATSAWVLLSHAQPAG
jgi:hypothetical protein